MRCIWRCGTVCPAAGPSLIPMLNPSGDVSDVIFSFAKSNKLIMLSRSMAVMSNHEATCFLGMMRL